MTKELLNTYLQILNDYDPEYLGVALSIASKECRFFPVPADIIDRMPKDANPKEIALFEAEEAWDKFKDNFHCYHPDLGYRGPKPDAAMEYAMRQIGGFERFSTTLVENENFIRKEFIEAHMRFDSTGGRLAPTRDEAKRLLDRLKKGELPE